jgi:hypothetical protein
MSNDWRTGALLTLERQPLSRLASLETVNNFPRSITFRCMETNAIRNPSHNHLLYQGLTRFLLELLFPCPNHSEARSRQLGTALMTQTPPKSLKLSNPKSSYPPSSFSHTKDKCLCLPPTPLCLLTNSSASS